MICRKTLNNFKRNKMKKNTAPATYNIIPKGMAGVSVTVVRKD
jgi:hypothetical protein